MDKVQFTMNGRVYETDIETLEVLNSLMPSWYKATSDASAIAAVIELGLKTGRIVDKGKDEEGLDKVEFKEHFDSPYDQYKMHNGKTFEVLGQVARDTYDYDEVGPMWKIKLSTGEVIDAWPEEVEIWARDKEAKDA